LLRPHTDATNHDEDYIVPCEAPGDPKGAFPEGKGAPATIESKCSPLKEKG
jgi:hypothetical protein